MVTELKRTGSSLDRIEELLGPNARTLLDHRSQTISKDDLQLPGPDFIDRVWVSSDRSLAVLRSMQTLFDNGRLAGTGYLSILPVDQGIEHSAGASFAPNPQYFDPENIVKLAIEGGCNAVASTFGVLGIVARRYAHRIPFIVKINHNELLTLPNKFDQVLFGTVKEAHNGNLSAPCRTELRPHVWLLKSPWCQENDQLVRFLKECENVLFEIGLDVNFRLIQEWDRPTSADLASDLFRYPDVHCAVTDED